MVLHKKPSLLKFPWLLFIFLYRTNESLLSDQRHDLICYCFCLRRNSFICVKISPFTTRRIFLEFSHSKPPYSLAKSQAASNTSCKS